MDYFWIIWVETKRCEVLIEMSREFNTCWSLKTAESVGMTGPQLRYIMMWAQFPPIFHLLYNKTFYSPHLNWFCKTFFVHQTWTCGHQVMKYIKSCCMVELPSRQLFCFSGVHLFVFRAPLVYLREYYCLHSIWCKKECKTKKLKVTILTENHLYEKEEIN